MVDNELIQAIGVMLDEKLDARFGSNNEMLLAEMDGKFESNNEMLLAEMDEKFRSNNEMLLAEMDERMDRKITASENMILRELDRVQEIGTRHYNELKQEIRNIGYGKGMLDSDALRSVITHTNDLEERVQVLEQKIG